jgi:hypothetical protein
MSPFEQGFITKCAQLGLDTVQTTGLFKAAMNPENVKALMATLGAGGLASGVGGLASYSRHGEVPRALLAGLGTGLGSLGGGAAGAVGGGVLGHSYDPEPSRLDTFLGRADAPKNTPFGLLGAGAGGLGGAGLGGLAGYHLGDLLAGPKKEDNK